MNRSIVPLWPETIASIGLGLLALAVAARMLAGCGGAPFVASDGLSGAPLTVDAGFVDGAIDAGEVLEDAETTGRDNHARLDAADVLAADAGDVLEDVHQSAPDRFTPVTDASASDAIDEVLEDARVDVVDAGAIPIDAGPPPPPPALCCLTPCSGGQVAAIACTSAPAWTCDATGASCSSARCSIGAGCHWQGATCAGTVAICP